MKKVICSLLIALVLVSCGSSKKVITSKSPSNKHTAKTSFPEKNSKVNKNIKIESSNSAVRVNAKAEVNKIIRKALSYKGTKYKYGGTTKKGMDCSGLMYVSFKSTNIVLPRTAIGQSKKGVRISKSKAEKGDLVFFKTGGKRSINHVGLIVSVDGRDVKFIHSSSSRGVMISSLREGYWTSAFVQIRRFSVINKIEESNTKTEVNALSGNHVVKKGDTLYGIATKYSGVSVSDIISYNKLGSTSLSPGMVLKIPK